MFWNFGGTVLLTLTLKSKLWSIYEYFQLFSSFFLSDPSGCFCLCGDQLPS